jgi:hypothetical protein
MLLHLVEYKISGMSGAPATHYNELSCEVLAVTMQLGTQSVSVGCGSCSPVRTAAVET